MTRPIYILFLLAFAANLFAQNPHGADMKINCAACHSSAGWEIEAKYWQDFDPEKPNVSRMTGMDLGIDSLRFHHGKTNFALKGQHAKVDCRGCHSTLVFSEANSDCVSCHTDMHQQTVGTDCARCHSSSNWLVDNITTLHQENGFPLTGVHQALDCAQCHLSASTLQFERIGNDCASCHLNDFNATTNPNHKEAGFSTECLECHDPFKPGWTTDKVNHDFFPLTKGHDISDCAKCHVGGDYSNTPNNCFACHQPDFQATTNPNHVQANFPNDCATCHTTDPDWTPAQYTQHDAAYFPIYSGKHQGQWTQCMDCHQNPSNFAEFSCTNCHINPETDNGHIGVNGYIYENTACYSCHATGDASVAFDHNATDFPLTGAHLSADCIQCHANGYVGTPTQCSACHTTDFNQAANPNHVALGLPTDCAMCHTTAPGWSPATFPIHNNYYALNGAHAAIANDCATCHNGNYTNTPNTCAGCHTPDYNATTNPNHTAAQFPTDCATCHSESAWAPSTFNHNTIYPFTGAHIAIANDCAACHHGNYTNTPNTCAGCHTPDFTATTNPNHVALNIPTDCAMCHTTAPGWEPATFPIHNNYYALNGAHAAIANDCATCHNGNYNSTPNTCAGCHTPDYNATTNPNHVAAQFPTDCATCHGETAWAPATFDHNTVYPFTGAHIAIANDCALCHPGGNYTNTPNTCAGCHTTDFNATTNPNHVALNLPTDCAMCHTTAPGWEPATFPIHNNYYALNGAHAAIANDCATCHNGNYNSTPNTCAGCHTPDYNQTTNPNHLAAQFPTDCATCHSETAWAPSTFNHNAFYPLNGAHAAIANDCALCHLGGNYTNTPNTCAGCHTPDYNAAINPNHVAAQFPTDCATCHNETAWAPSSFDHNAIYPLIGAHAAIANDCALCHVGGNYTNTPNTCAGCHTPDYNGATDPNHVAAQFPTDCAICHTQTAWAPSTFDHNTIYPFTGAHIAIANDCALCHVGGNYTNTPNTCAGCHTPDYNGSTNPNHVALAIPTDCAMCHTTTPGWEPATFPIHSSYYALNGAHAAIANDCATCHNGNYNNTPNTCNGCHAADYNGTTDPNHAAAQFPTDCAICHTETAWAPSTFDHNTIYPFTGAHIAIADDCNACHHGDYSNTPTTCAGCHTPDYNASTNPNHVALAIPTDCAMCHTTTPGWEPATFPIHNNYYVLNGAHTAIANDCATCHNGDYNNTPNTCFGCHTAEYNGTANPNHITAQFPTDCAICHSETAWIPSTFDHNTIYPFTGAHIAIADDCNACHHGDFNNTPNTCAGCHTPAYNASINPNHVALAIPTDCAMCHTTTPGWEPATFPIHNNYYALNGAHIAIANDCATCHNGDYNNTPNTCFGCHTADYNGTLNPNHITAQFPTDCATCHSETAWVPSNFDHNTIYPFTGAHIAIADDCNACHHGDYNNTPNTCAGCHTPAYNASINPNHVALAIPTDCAMCHTTTPGWEPATFPIHNNYYALNGAHIAIANDCATCHHGDYNNTPNTCFGCHAADYNGTTNPNHITAQFPTDCAICHSETAWVPSTFDHNTIYPFTGAHIAIANDCDACHHGDYNNTPNTCAGCHTPDYNASLNPNHIALVLPTDCAMCHTTAPGWEPATFPIHNNYYALNGAHAGISNDCATCHHGDYNNTPNTCVGCHQADYNGTANPNHIAAQFPTDCKLCHGETAWIPSTFDHNAIYPFTGAHIAIANDCNACHHGDYNNTPNTCAGCHTPDYNASLNPNHTALVLPTDCAMCHTTEPGWAPATFPIHNNYWPLNGAHAGISNDCAACHNGDYNNTPNTCVGCHQADYNGASDPNHAANQLPTTCQTCHSETAWVPSTFDHNIVYPFTGAHIAIADDCNACHHGNYINVPNTCAGCHTPDYNASLNPKHTALNIPTDCAMCHTTAPGWEPATFPIHNNYWPLNGAHAGISNDCAACHNGNYNNTPNTCVGCHQADYNGASNPNHSANQFPTTCQDCHTETAWAPSTFDHSTIFPFTGAHIPIADDCNACHHGDYNNTPNTCAGCHTPDYNGSSNPNHTALNIPTDCAMCHTTEPDWMPATFPIHDNYWALTGAHLNADCVDCHNGNYNNTPTTCYGCHQTDYNNANNPDHSAAQFPTTCQDCHSTSGWVPSTWDHDQQYFPIYSGKHKNEWDQCVECHTTPGNFSLFSCIDCHEHDDPANMADHHQGVPGYQYSSPACYNCHPDGSD